MPHFTWIIFAFVIGVGISYAAFNGVVRAYDILTTKTVEYVVPSVTVLPVVIPPKSVEKVLNIGFVGDIIPSKQISPDVLSEISSYTESPDVMIGNFEGDATETTNSKCKQLKTNCFAFKGDQDFLNLLASTYFDVLNVANNHFNDYGQEGQKQTLEEMTSAGVMSSGVKDQITYITRNDITLGILGFSTYEWTDDMNNTEKLTSKIKEAKMKSDVVVVIFHGGGEGEAYSHTPDKKEWYLDEDRGDVRASAHNAIDAGADLVLGSGPHVLRGMEKYNDKLISYSLGNFLSANNFKKALAPRISAILNITIKKDGSLVSGEIIPLQIDEYGVPHLDPENTAIGIINDLSKADFGEEGVTINPDRQITVK